MLSLLQSIFTILLAHPAEGLAETPRTRILAASEPALQAALSALAPHKVLPLLSHQLKAYGLIERLPAAPRAVLREAQAETQALNTMLLLSAASILRAAQREASPPLALKGLLLADSYYPDPSTRPMNDIDLVAAPGQHLKLYALLETLGFRPSAEHAQVPDGVTYVDARGLLCDAHCRLRVFDAVDWGALTVVRELSKLRGVAVLSLAPDPMLAHLAVHMHGHLRELGPVLLWFLDIAFVLRRHGHELNLDNVRALCADDGAFSLLLRTTRLLGRYGEHVPAPFARRARFLPPLSLGAVLRQRRITPWGVPTPKGFARLLARQLSLRRYERWPTPQPTDLLLWPLDELYLRSSARLVRSR